jgi:hypothetical protein
VLDDKAAFLKWLDDEPRVSMLRFGNHRKHENTTQLRRVFSGFIKLVKRYQFRSSLLIKTPGASKHNEIFDAPDEQDRYVSVWTSREFRSDRSTRPTPDR